MLRTLRLPLLIISTLLAACGAPVEGPIAEAPMTLPAPASQGATSGPEAATDVEIAPDAPSAPVEPAAGVATALEPATARDPNRDFTTTDPSTVQVAAGRPQLFEFFAHW